MSEGDQRSAGVVSIPPIAVSRTTTRVNKTGSWKYIQPLYRDQVAPCNAACPVGIDIEGYMAMLREGRTEEAVDLLLRENPMPAVTGRVCHHPCETGCNRRFIDESVSIHAVERALGDRALKDYPVERPSRLHDQRVAVVGSGPAGLGCAYHLAGLGYGVTVYESADEPGGMLRLGIPEYRLPRDILDRQIDRIRSMGVEIRCGAAIGSDVPWSDLDDFAAVFIASGAHVGRDAGFDAGGLEGVRSGLEFLKEVNAGGRPSLGRRVVVVGGGNTAMDCARAAIRLGSSVLVVYRRTRSEMPAIPEEIDEAALEGVDFEFLAVPASAEGAGGRLESVICQRMELGAPDDSGRRRPLRVEGQTFRVQCDAVLTAIGEVTDLGFIPARVRVGGSLVEVDELGASTSARVFAGGDIVDAPRSVADALGSGKRAAIGIDAFLQGRDFEAAELGEFRIGGGNLSMGRYHGTDPVSRVAPENTVVPFEQMNPNHFDALPRRHDRFATSARSRTGFTEVNLGLTEREAADEAARCLSCGVCNECELCMIFCPDMAITRRPDGKGFDIDLDFCKGCGVCVAECPRGAIYMTRIEL